MVCIYNYKSIYHGLYIYYTIRVYIMHGLYTGHKRFAIYVSVLLCVVLFCKFDL